jgi:hypothetical protein
MPVAVVSDPRESDLAIVDRSGFAESLGVSSIEWATIEPADGRKDRPTNESPATTTADADEVRRGDREWTWGVLLSLLLVLLGETFLAERSSRGAMSASKDRSTKSVGKMRASIGGGQ